MDIKSLNICLRVRSIINKSMNALKSQNCCRLLSVPLKSRVYYCMMTIKTTFVYQTKVYFTRGCTQLWWHLSIIILVFLVQVFTPISLRLLATLNQRKLHEWKSLVVNLCSLLLFLSLCSRNHAYFSNANQNHSWCEMPFLNIKQSAPYLFVGTYSRGMRPCVIVLSPTLG